MDIQDRRPLFIDQPEENLDPQSVLNELVPHFRAARQRRQVIVVTHNANFVVNTDADQVIIASSQPRDDGGLPAISYESGSLENPNIRAAVCKTAGGRQARLCRTRAALPSQLGRIGICRAREVMLQALRSRLDEIPEPSTSQERVELPWR